jgi:hypothetical protein
MANSDEPIIQPPINNQPPLPKNQGDFAIPQEQGLSFDDKPSVVPDDPAVLSSQVDKMSDKVGTVQRQSEDGDLDSRLEAARASNDRPAVSLRSEDPFANIGKMPSIETDEQLPASEPKVSKQQSSFNRPIEPQQNQQPNNRLSFADDRGIQAAAAPRPSRADGQNQLKDQRSAGRDESKVARSENLSFGQPNRTDASSGGQNIPSSRVPESRQAPVAPKTATPPSGPAGSSAAGPGAGSSVAGDAKTQAIEAGLEAGADFLKGNKTFKQAVGDLKEKGTQFVLRTLIDGFIRLIPELVVSVVGNIAVVLGFLVLNVIWFIGFFKPSFNVLKFHEKFIIAFVDGVLIFIATVAIVLSVAIFCQSQGVVFGFLAGRGLLPPGLEFCQVVYDSVGADSGSITPGLGNGQVGGPYIPPSPGAHCSPLDSGPASLANLQNSCWGSNAAKASGIAREESEGDPLSASKSDKCATDGATFSWGLFQINIVANNVIDANGDALACPTAFEKGKPYVKRDAQGKIYYDCKVINRPLYDRCVTALKNPQVNINNACTIYLRQGWNAWSTNSTCKF